PRLTARQGGGARGTIPPGTRRARPPTVLKTAEPTWTRAPPRKWPRARPAGPRPGSGGADGSLDLDLDARLRAVPDDALLRLAAAEDEQGRDAHDAELARADGIGVDVDLDHLRASLELDRELLDDGGDHLAGSTPRSPQV